MVKPMPFYENGSRIISTIILCSVLFIPHGIQAQEEEAYELDIRFASNYVDRGEDIFSEYAVQKGRSYGVASGAPVFQPSLVYNTPLEGIYFQLDGSFAMAGRDDRDSDGVLQYGPGGPSLLGGWGDPSLPVLSFQGGFDRSLLETRIEESSFLLGALLNHDIALEDYYSEELGVFHGVPGFYREENGLKKYDKIIGTIGYSDHTSIGTFGFGLTVDTRANESGKDSPTTELFVMLAPSFYEDLFFEAYVDLDNSDNYFLVGWGYSVDINNSLGVTFDISAGYQVTEGMKGWRDVTGRFGLNLGQLSIGINTSIRPDWRFYDDDPSDFDNLPLYLFGMSTSTDGLVEDPGATAGLTNQTTLVSIDRSFAEKGISDYSYTPRQKLPRQLVWVDVGYTFTF